SNPGRTSPYSEHELALFAAYQKVRDLRSMPDLPEVQLRSLVEQLEQQFANEWLLALEVYEILQSKGNAAMQTYTSRVEALLKAVKKQRSPEVAKLIDDGMALAAQ